MLPCSPHRPHRGVRLRDTQPSQSPHPLHTSPPNETAARSWAEWIAEAPSSGGEILPLANFGTVDYGADFTGVHPTCYATVSGTTGPIATFGAAVQDITMVSASKAVEAQPSGLSTNGTSFAVTWVSAGP